MTADGVAYSVDEIWKKYAATASMTEYAGIERPDAATVVIRFSRPVPEFFFASLLSGAASYILPKHVYSGARAGGARQLTPPQAGFARRRSARQPGEQRADRHRPLEIQGVGAGQPL